MGTVLAVIYAADTIVAFKYYRDSSFDWSPPTRARDIQGNPSLSQHKGH